MNQQNEIRPPKWPVNLLRFFLKWKYVEEIEGDMEEIFYDNVEQLSHRKANLHIGNAKTASTYINTKYKTISYFLSLRYVQKLHQGRL